MSTLYGILTANGSRPAAELVARAGDALSAGLPWLQLRAKGIDAAAATDLAERLAEACTAAGAVLVVNDDVELARRFGAGVHLGQGDTPWRRARALLGEQALVGVSCHADVELAVTVLRQGASYASIGRLFASRTKPDAPGAALQCLRQARARTTGRLCAIGGIDARRIADVAACGADLIAVGAAIFEAPDPGQAVYDLIRAMHCDRP